MSELRQRPQQARSHARVEAILDAAERTIAELGYLGATTNHIAEAAGISVGSLYRWFPDKEAIARELVERYLGRLSDIAASAFETHQDDGTPDLIRHVVDGLAGVWLAQPALSVLVAASIGPTGPDSPGIPLRALLIDRANALLQLRVPDLPTREREVVARLCIGLLEGALLEAAGDADLGPELVAEAAYAIAAYLAMKYPFADSHRWLDPMQGLPPSRPSVR